MNVWWFLSNFGMSCLATGFVQAATTDVANPFDDIVIRVVQLGLKHFQVANFETRRSKRNLRRIKYKVMTQKMLLKDAIYLKVHRNGWASPFLFSVRLQKLDFRRQLRFFHASHTFDPRANKMLQLKRNEIESILERSNRLPNDGVLRCLVFGLALHAQELDARSIQRRWNANLNLLCQ